MNIPEQFVTWIMRCMHTAAFSVSINGELEGFFSSSRGVRQGCSLSPYLYVIVSNVLSKLINKAVTTRRIGHHHMCQEVNLTHLSFADDIIVFLDGSPSSLNGALEVFQNFANISGLCINVASTGFSAGGGEAGFGDFRWRSRFISLCSAHQIPRTASYYKNNDAERLRAYAIED